MPSIKKHFRSFESFVKLQNSLRVTSLSVYYRNFGNIIGNRLVKKVDSICSNEKFMESIKNLIVLPGNFSELISIEEVGLIKSEADQLSMGTYNLLGSGEVKLNPVDWHADFKTGHRWPPGCFYKDYTQEGIETDSDVKVPREMSRCHHLLKLGLSYQFTGDEQFAGICVHQITDWIKENPLMRSINWGCTMDVAIRAVNWIWAMKLISGSPSLTDENVTKIKISLYEHGWFIYRNPEKSSFNNHNHYLADLAGQIHIGLVFKCLDEPKKWIEEGTRELFREMRTQILPSGMSYERSTNYNRLVLELLLVPILLLKRNGHEIPTDISFRIEKMFEFIMHTLKPDGNTPIIGDQDDGRLLPFGCEINTNYRYLLSLGSILYNRSDFKTHGGGYNIYCAILGGLNSNEKYAAMSDHKPYLNSCAFPDAGFYVMRKEDSYLLFNASGKGHYPEIPSGTHTHSDLLSFELFTQGKSFLVDPGSYAYTANATLRMLFRSTSMHNTVTIDGESQNVLRKDVLWNFERNAIPELLEWVSTETLDKVVARHNGYLRLKQPVIHQRMIIFDKEKLCWQIKDNLIGEGCHKIEWYFHFDTGIDFSINNTEVQTICEDGQNISLTFIGNASLQLRKEKSFVSKAYGTKEEGLVLVVAMNDECPQELNIVIQSVV